MVTRAGTKSTRWTCLLTTLPATPTVLKALVTNIPAPALGYYPALRVHERVLLKA